MANNRIYSVDWLKGVMILIIVIYHSYFFEGFRGYLAVDVFFFISGYFLMFSFLRRPSTAVLYTWSRIKSIAAPYFISLILVCLQSNCFNSAIGVYDSFIDFTGKLISTIPFAEEFAASLTRTPFLLGCWFLSVLIIGAFLLYGILEYNQRLATMVLFPAIVLLGYNAILNNSECLNNFSRVGLLGVPLVRGICDMASGALICHVYIQYKASIEKHTGLINILGFISFFVFMALMFTEEALDKYIIVTIPWILMAAVIDHSWMNTALCKIKGGLFARLGRYTIYVYCIHGVAQTTIFWFNDKILHHALDGAPLFIAYLCSVAAASVCLYYICQFITRFINARANQPDHTRL